MIKPIKHLISNVYAQRGENGLYPVVYLPLFFLAISVDLCTPLVIGKILNVIQESKEPKELLGNLFFYLIIYVLLKFAFWIPHGIGRILEQIFAFMVEVNYKTNIFNKLLDLPLKWHTDQQSGDLIDKANKASKSLFAFTDGGFIICYSVFKYIVAFGFLFYLHYQTALLAFFISSIIFFIIFKIDKNLFQIYKNLNIFSNKVNACFFDFLSNVTTVITLNIENKAINELKRKILAPYKIFIKKCFINELKWSFATISSRIMLGICLIFYVNNMISHNQVFLAGSFYAILGYLNQIEGTFYDFGMNYGIIVERSADLENTKSIIDAHDKLEKEKTKINELKTWDKLELKNIVFSYSDKTNNSKGLKNINLEINKGEKIAFVGESGSGKTTLLKLLAGVINPNSGDFLIDSNNNKTNQKIIAKKTTLIPQEPEIFANTIRYNVSLVFDVAESLVMDAITIAEFEKVLSKLPDNLDTNIAEKGINLSGGEKQRLALARGLFFARDSEILLLDEPTSSVDIFNETKIYENIFREFSDKTIISSVHKPHLLKSFDKIFVFEAGEITFTGTYEELSGKIDFSRFEE